MFKIYDRNPGAPKKQNDSFKSNKHNFSRVACCAYINQIKIYNMHVQLTIWILPPSILSFISIFLGFCLCDEMQFAIKNIFIAFLLCLFHYILDRVTKGRMENKVFDFGHINILSIGSLFDGNCFGSCIFRFLYWFN